MHNPQFSHPDPRPRSFQTILMPLDLESAILSEVMKREAVKSSSSACAVDREQTREFLIIEGQMLRCLISGTLNHLYKNSNGTPILHSVVGRQIRTDDNAE